MTRAMAITDWFTKIGTTNYFPQTIRIFLYSLYGWVLCNALLLLPEHHILWSPQALTPAMSALIPTNWHAVFYLLSYDAINAYYVVCLCGQLIATGLCLWRITWRWPRLLALFFTYNLDNRAYLILDGGNNIIHLMLIYALLLEPSPQVVSANTWLQQIRYALSNATVVVGRVQICFIYLVAGLTKVTGDTWQQGTALFYTLNVTEYMIPWVADLMTRHYYLSVVGSYATLLFQLSFPWLVWFRQTRYVVLAGGTFLHLQISFVMGLLMFGFAMMVCYTLFTPEARSAALVRRWTRGEGARSGVPAERSVR